MITICIPIYNFEVNALIQELLRQVRLINAPYELIAIDDASDEKYRQLNDAICKEVCYIPLEKNIGRAKIRNLFFQYAKYDNLLFLDCDSLIISPNFIEKYIEAIQQGEYAIICGGRLYQTICPEKNKRLRWKYGIEKESQPLEVRRKAPNKSFMTNNFLIHRRIFQAIQFEERITEYGHEDTLFGFLLKQKGINIKHIDNPILNGDIEDNIVYLAKTEKGIMNLLHILKYVNDDENFIKDVMLLATYKTLKIRKLTTLIYYCFIVVKPLLKFLLTNGFISIFLFDFYKLGILIESDKAVT